MPTLAFADVIRARGYTTGVEVGVWRGDRAQHLLDTCDLKLLVMVDPWLLSLNVFPVTPEDRTPPRMPLDQYQCTMGEPLMTSQAAYDEMALEVRRKFEPYGARALILREVSELAAKRFLPASFDFVLIDAIHLYRYVKADIEAWRPLVKPGGLLGGDDYMDPGIGRAVDELFGRSAVTHPACWWVTP
jgi:hypothetical protein